MNEDELSKKITGYLDRGASNLKQSTLDGLHAARQLALSKYAQAKPVSVPAWAPSGGPFRSGGFRGLQFWGPFLAILLTLSGIWFWQSQQHAADQAELDAALLAGDLPLDAYINHDFDKWVNRSSQ